MAVFAQVSYNLEEKQPHFAAASESAANTVQRPKPQATKEQVIYV